ncbi:O-antigen translocase [Paracoccus sp. SJTW-4]|uniref:O-antigen translocase n=1 Tax=Paracoccus sp. SJTW-4 TaxID=3078428 RepID=UPI0039E9873F
MLLIGSAQAVNILISLLRMKLLAVMVGPVGLGLLANYSNLQSTVGTLAGLGLGNSGVREIAAAKHDPTVLSRVRLVLLAANLVQGTLAMVAIWFLRVPISRWLTGSAEYATEIGLVGVAVLLGLVSASQTALLQGLRRIGDLGRVTILSALAGTVAGLLTVWLQGDDGLIWFLIAQPTTSVLVALWFTRRLPSPEVQSWTIGAVWSVWKPMAALGVVFMLAALASSATLLVVRGLISRELGLEAAGLFAASWAIAMTYIGFLLGAMGADYYPRLVEVINDPAKANQLMNDQMQIGLALGGPILLALTGLAPWFLGLLYSPDFIPAAGMLQWQSFGNVLKLSSWPLGFALVAAARSRIYLFTQLSWNIVFLGTIWIGLPLVGLEVAGVGFALAYLVLFLLAWTIAHHLSSFRFARLSATLLGFHLTASVAMLSLAYYAPVTAALTGVLLALVGGIVGLRVVLIKIGPQGPLAARLSAFFTAIGWPIRSKP